MQWYQLVLIGTDGTNSLVFFLSFECNFITTSIFLIDHAWTYEAEFARVQLAKLPGLAKRMALLMDILESEEKNDHCDMTESKEERLSKEGLNQNSRDMNGTSSGNKAEKKFSLSEGFYTDENGISLSPFLSIYLSI